MSMVLKPFFCYNKNYMNLFNFLKKDSFTVFESLLLILIFLLIFSLGFFTNYGFLGNFIVLIAVLSANIIGPSGILTFAFSFLFFYLKKKNQKSFKDYNVIVFTAILVLCAFVDIAIRNYIYSELQITGFSVFTVMEHWFMAPLVFLFFFFNLAKRKYYPEVK